MKSKISVIVGSVLALAITATEPVHAKGSDCTGQDLMVTHRRFTTTSGSALA